MLPYYYQTAVLSGRKLKSSTSYKWTRVLMIISGVLIVLIVIIKSLEIHRNKTHISGNDETSDILIMGTTRSGKTRNIKETPRFEKSSGSFNFINYEQRKEENE